MTAVIAAIIAWFFARKKNKAEIAKIEADALTQLRNLVNDLTNDVVKLKVENGRKDERIHTLEDTVKQIETLRDRVRTLEQQVTLEQEKFILMNSQKDKEIQGLRDDLVKKAQEMHQLETDFNIKLKEKDSEINKLREQIEELENKFADFDVHRSDG